MSDAKKLKLKVTGERTIHCAGCERSLKFTLENLPGVREVEADHEKQLIEVTLVSDETDLEKVKAELEWIGYEAEVA